jgi:6-pyruvoyltetrahydropterin/6-carboxytetrahydropterin synthase
MSQANGDPMNKHLIPRDVGATSTRIAAPHDAIAKLETRIGRTYHFESAHHLPLLPDRHKCKNVHGHNYRVDVILRGPLDMRGFVKDFAEIDAEVTPLIEQLDHHLLNEVTGLENPTAEIIAAWFFEGISD